MKLIEVSSDGDYGAVMFEQSFEGTNTKVSDFIAKNFVDGRTQITYTFEHQQCGETDVNIYLYEYGAIDLNFVNLIRHKFMDYDDKKHHNFYFENEILNG
jgi:hypothetical protein